MATKIDDIQAQLNALKEAYANQLPEKFNEIERYRECLMEDDKSLVKNSITLHRLVHSLAGSGATFGFHDLSQQARQIQQIVNHWASGDVQKIISDEEKVSTMFTNYPALDNTTDISHAADKALYQAKAKGRNRTEIDGKSKLA